MIPTNKGLMSPQQLICELTYSNYAYNRDLGMSAERLARIFPTSGAAMEERYLKEKGTND